MSALGTERIGIIEVGSKAARFLVADIAWNGSFRQVDAGAYTHGIDLDFLKENGVVAIRPQLNQMLAAVEKFYERINRHRCSKTAFYGTELCRRLKEQPEFSLPFHFEVLTQEIEALGAWAAGFLATEMMAGRYTIIDQGNGSTEIITAYGDSKKIEVKDLADISKLDVGNQEIERRFSADGIPPLVSWLRSRLDAAGDKLKRHEARLGAGRSLVLLGSAPTKLAFNIKHKRDDEDDYDPGRTHKTILATTDITNYYNSMMVRHRKDPEGAQRSIDRRVNEFPLVMGGALLVLLICQRLGFGELRVSRYGTRHGIGFLIRRGKFG